MDPMPRGGADAVAAAHPLFPRLFCLLALEGQDDETTTRLVARVHQRAGSKQR